MGAKLVVVSGANAGSDFNLMTDRLVMGRSDEADVVLVDRSISRRHIEVFRDAAGYSVRDLSSGNGTFLNGSRIREAELINGDRVEIGEHVLEYREYPAVRQAHQRQVVYNIDRNQAAAPPAPGPPPPAPSQPQQQQLQVPVPKKVIAAPPAAYRKRPSKRKKGVAGWLIALLVFVFVGLAGAVGYVFYSRSQTVQETVEDPVAESLRLGDEALEQMAWGQAQDHFNAILRNDPNHEAANHGLAIASTEQRYATLMEEAERLISVGEYNHAIVNLRSVVEESERQGGLAQARLDRLFDDLVAEGRSAVDRRDFAAAEAFASVVLEANPQHRNAAALLDEVSVVRGAQQAVASAEAAEATEQEEAESSERRRERRERRARRERERERDDDDDDNGGASAAPVVAAVVVPDPTPPPTPTRSASSDDDDADSAFSRGWRLYRDGDFSGAAAWFDDYGASNDSELGDQAVQNAERMRSFAESYEPGKEAYDSADYDIAVHDLRRAYSLDRRLEEAYRADIASMLADSYYQLAQSDYDDDDFRDAGSNAQIALRYNDRHRDTLDLVRQLEERANEMYIDAVSFRESNPERAAQLCRDIEGMLPESSALRRRAAELREQL